MPLIDDVKQHVRGVRTVGEIADFVDDQDRRMSIGRQGHGQFADAKAGGQIVDQGRSRREERIEAVLNRTVGVCDRGVRFAASGFAGEDDRRSVTKSGASAEPSMCSRSDD